MSDDVVRVSLFPGTAHVPLYYALDHGLLSTMRVEITEATSSPMQLAGWDGGRYDIMHTATDHLVRARRGVDPCIVRVDPIGELSVYVKPELVDLRTARWAVDAPDTAFALVLRAVLEECAGIGPSELELVPVGGTKQRFEALIADGADGATLHSPFDALVANRGFRKVGGHFDVAPALLAVATVAPRARVGSPEVQAYLGALDDAVEILRTSGPPVMEEVLCARGWEPMVAAVAARSMTEPGAIGVDRKPTLEGLQAVADLRRRYFPDWRSPVPLGELIAA